MFSSSVSRSHRAVRVAEENNRVLPTSKRQLPRPPANDSAPLNTELKVRLHQQLLDVINLSVLENMEAEDIRREVGATIVDLLKTDLQTPLNLEQQSRVVSEVLDELTGLGPIEPLVKDSSISDILVNTHAKVYIERNGRIELTEVRFKDDRHLMRIIDKIVSSVGRRGRSSPCSMKRMRSLCSSGRAYSTR